MAPRLCRSLAASALDTALRLCYAFRWPPSRRPSPVPCQRAYAGRMPAPPMTRGDGRETEIDPRACQPAHQFAPVVPRV
jgi:hypothetical protein